MDWFMIVMPAIGLACCLILGAIMYDSVQGINRDKARAEQCEKTGEYLFKKGRLYPMLRCPE